MNTYVTHTLRRTISASITVLLLAIAPMQDLSAEPFDPKAHRAIIEDAKNVARIVHKREQGLKEQVSPIENAVPTQEISKMFEGFTKSGSFIPQSTSGAMGQIGQIFNKMNSMMKGMGGSGKGGLMPPLPKSSNYDQSEKNKFCQTIQDEEHNQALPVYSDGKVLATPIASVAATLISGGGSVCPPNSQKGQQTTACDENAYKDDGQESSNTPLQSPSQQKPQQEFAGEKIE